MFLKKIWVFSQREKPHRVRFVICVDEKPLKNTYFSECGIAKPVWATPPHVPPFKVENHKTIIQLSALSHLGHPRVTVGHPTLGCPRCTIMEKKIVHFRVLAHQLSNAWRERWLAGSEGMGRCLLSG
jgi:hypothetical protein